jgi:hypothetical protein
MEVLRRGVRGAGPAMRPEGRRVTAPVTFTTMADANAWLAYRQTGAGPGVGIDATLGKVLFGDYAHQSVDNL